MKQFFSSSFFVNFVIPCVTVMFSIFIKSVSRDDEQPMLKKEDFAIGFELSLASLFAFATYSAALPDRIATTQDQVVKQALESKSAATPWLILVWVVGLWAVSTLVRKLGWNPILVGAKTKEPTWWCGIIIPSLFGLITLVLVVNWVK
jgi:di/tricarboxylate transporter